MLSGLDLPEKWSLIMDNLIITIGRQYGSGGHEIGEKLAAHLGIKFYDQELLTVAAKHSGLSRDLLEINDEKPMSLLFSLSTGGYGADMSINHKLFLAQFEAIQLVARESPCVIVGRCADYALRDFSNCVNVFVYADLPHRIRRISNLYEKPARVAEETIIRTDRRRASYYSYYTGKKWGSMENYDIALNTSRVGIDNAVKLIADFAQMQNDREPFG